MLCQQKGCEVILDISHPVLRQLLEWRPLLIKPNDDELERDLWSDVSSPGGYAKQMQTLHQLGARNVLLTLGAQGLYFSNGVQLWFCLGTENRTGQSRPAPAMPRWVHSSAIGLTQTIFPRPWRWPAPPALMWPPPPGWVN